MFPPPSLPARSLKRKSPEVDELEEHNTQPACKLHCKCDCASVCMHDEEEKENTITMLPSFAQLASSSLSTPVPSFTRPSVSTTSATFGTTTTSGSTFLSTSSDATSSPSHLSSALAQCRLEPDDPPSCTTPAPTTPPQDNQLLRSCLTRCIEPNSYSQERHLVFSISMSKLNKARCGSEPSLLRSVLICNTLKRLERQLDAERLRLHPLINDEMHYTPSIASPTEELNSTPPIQDDLMQPPSPPLDSMDESDRYLYLFFDLDANTSGRLTPFIREEEKRTSGDSFTSTTAATPSNNFINEESSDRINSLNWNSVLNFGIGDEANNSSSEPREEHMDRLSGDLHILQPASVCTTISSTSTCTITPASNVSSLNSSFSSPAPSSSRSGTQDEIFGDIDLSLYDFDILSPLSPPNVKLTPVTAEELMRTLTENNGSTSSTSIASTSLATSTIVTSTSSSSSANELLYSASSSCTSSSTLSSLSSSTDQPTINSSNTNGGCGSSAGTSFSSSNPSTNFPTMIS